jgi:hypothetical protein
VIAAMPHVNGVMAMALICVYKERKKSQMRLGYGREPEQRLDRLEDILCSACSNI